MKQACFDPEAMGLIAVAGLRDELPREPDAIISELQDRLGSTRSIGLRNAIRLALKDLYKSQGDDQAVFTLLRQMLEENDNALRKQENRR